MTPRGPTQHGSLRSRVLAAMRGRGNVSGYDLATVCGVSAQRVTGAMWKLAEDGLIVCVEKRNGEAGGSIYSADAMGERRTG